LFEHLGRCEQHLGGASTGLQSRRPVELLINDESAVYTVRGVYPDSNGNESAIVMDIATAQQALSRYAASIASS